MTPPADPERYKHHRFPGEIISHGVWLYYRHCQITYHPQSGWFEDTPLKGGTEEGCPLKGVHEGTFLIEAGHPAWNHSRASGLTGVLRLGLLYGLGSGLPHKTSSAPPQRRNGRACSSLTARGGGLPVGVMMARNSVQLP